MTFEETNYLLPLYLAGSLTPEQRAAVQEALKIHPELRDELKFWNGILQATLLDLAEEGLHPISEQIVTYAEGTLHSGEERLTVEGHLQTCAPCCEELLLLKEPDQQEPAIRAARTDPKGLFFSRTIRVQLAWGSALAAIAVFAWFYLSSRDDQRHHGMVPPVGIGETTTVALPRVDQVKRMRLILPLRSSLRHRETTRGSLPVRLLDDSVDMVDIMIPVEHSAVAVGYTVRLFASTGKTLHTADSPNPIRSREKIDTLRLSVAQQQFSGQWNYELHAREILKEGIKGIEPEEYRYEFVLRRAPNR
jgi:hypothetical protein